MAVFRWKKERVCEVVANFGGFRRVVCRGECFGLFVEHVVASQPDGACEGVKSFECHVRVVVAAFEVGLSIIELRARCQAKPRKCEESLHQLVPSDVALLLQCRLYVVMVSGRDLIMREGDWGAWVLEMLINTGRNANTVWMLVQTC